MTFHPSTHLEIARRRQRDLLAEAKRRRIARAALVDRRENRRRHPNDKAVRHLPSPTTTAPGLQRSRP